MATWREKKKKERSNRKRQMQEVGWVFLRVMNEKHQYGNWKKRDKEMMCNWLGRSNQLIALTQL